MIADFETMYVLVAVFVSLALWIVIACFTGWLAARKGYSSSRWSLLGFLFGAVALFAMVGAPMKQDAIYILKDSIPHRR